ncbi:MAG: response regulator transcription factor [Anaerolineae bacterium]|nr:response regulator transcription factor [Anaerolineae bacterium]
MTEQRIMIVDDHEVVRLGLKNLLSHHADFEVVAEARTAKEAIEKADLHPLDVILMDIRLPGASGIEACQAIKHKHPDIKVIMLTSYEEDEMLFSALRAGAETYLLKQIDGQSLIQAIEAVSRGEALLDPGVTKRVLDEVRRAKRQEEAKAFTDLTAQEMQVLNLVSEGKTNREIAQALFLGEGTVRNYVSNILSKLTVANRAEAAAYAVQHHLKDYL